MNSLLKRWKSRLAVAVLGVGIFVSPAFCPITLAQEPTEAAAPGEGSGRSLDGYLGTTCLVLLALFMVGEIGPAMSDHFRTAVFTGTFDPISLGHLDVIQPRLLALRSSDRRNRHQRQQGFPLRRRRARRDGQARALFPFPTSRCNRSRASRFTSFEDRARG